MLDENIRKVYKAFLEGVGSVSSTVQSDLKNKLPAFIKEKPHLYQDMYNAYTDLPEFSWYSDAKLLTQSPVRLHVTIEPKEGKLDTLDQPVFIRMTLDLKDDVQIKKFKPTPKTAHKDVEIAITKLIAWLKKNEKNLTQTLRY